MTYEQALEWIHATPRFGQEPGLERMAALMGRLGTPHVRFPCVHIAGTNGKGSIAAMTAAMLHKAGFRTGLFTSPYLEDFRERIQINGEEIPPNDLARLADEVRSASRGLRMTEFELVTAIGFCWFARQGCDIVVLEVGLGGRLDATNLIPPPLCAVIASISLDHTMVLGETVEEIAGEKGGILKEGSQAVLAPDQPEGAEQVIRQICREKNIPLIRAAVPKTWTTGLDGTELTWRGRIIHLPLRGSFQAGNAAAALAVVEVLRSRGWKISDQAVADGLEAVRWPGRMELLQDEPPILLDCAHNPGGLACLSGWMKEQLAGRRIITVMGMLSDKDHRTGIREIAGQSDLFLAVPPPSPRAMAAAEIAREAEGACGQVRAFDHLPEALDQALEALAEDGALVVCGSIPLVGEARKYLRFRLNETANNG